MTKGKRKRRRILCGPREYFSMYRNSTLCMCSYICALGSYLCLDVYVAIVWAAVSCVVQHSVYSPDCVGCGGHCIVVLELC